jgi:superfamily II DNA or RNA helicase
MKKIKIEIENCYTKIFGINRETVRKLSDITSYILKGSWFSKSYQKGNWSGKEKLLEMVKTGGYRFPTGLLYDVTKYLEKQKIQYKIIDKRRKPKHKDFVLYSWNQKIKLRNYQNKAFEKISKKDLYFGNGILKMPIRSGKTKTIAWIIGFLSVRTLFIVPSKSLLYQTQKSLEESLLCKVGLIGDGKWEEQNITVATAQTLSKSRMSNDPKWKKLIKRYFCIIFDEAHHLTAPTWHKTMMEFDAPYKLGLSATAFPEMDGSQWDKGSIWLKACCGRIRVSVDTSDLIEQGYLTKPIVKLYKIDKPDLSGKGWSQSLRNKAIYENKIRNKKITEVAKKYTKKGKLVLVVTNRLNQVKILSEMFDKAGINHETMTSADSTESRENKVSDFVNHKTDALIGTILSEGVDIPEIDVVINAEGGTDIKSTVQKMRNLTVCDGKKNAIFVDFIDLTNKYFANHSKSRLSVYKSERAFRVKLVAQK